MEIIFHSHADKTHFHKKGFAPSLILKVRVFGTRKWPIEIYSQYARKISICLNRGRMESLGNDDGSIVRAREYEMVRMT